MADISKITLPNGSKYNIKDSTARTESVTSASISGSGLLEFRNAAGNLLFTLQLPLHPLYIPFTNIADFFARSTNQISSLSVVVGPPTQDLHGYSSPWPAGGGVSKCPSFANGTHTMTNGLTVTIQDGEITIDGTASGSGYYEEAIESTVMPADTYVSFNNPVGTYNIAYVFINGNTQIAAPSLYPANGTKQPTGLSGATVNKLRIYCNAGTYDNFKMSPIVHDGSTPQAWQPYANICPISGRTGLSVYDDPKYGGTVAWNQLYNRTDNLTTNGITFTNSNGRVSISGQASGNAFYTYVISGGVKAGHKYLLAGGNSDSLDNTPKLYAAFVDSSRYNLINGKTATIFSFSSDVAGSITVYAQSGWDADLNPRTFIPQFFDLTQMFGSTIADYVYSLEQNTAGAGVAWFRNLFPNDYYTYNAGEETCVSAVNGDPYWKKTVDWISEVGTVYAGSYEAISGKLKARPEYSSYNGETLVGPWLSSMDVYAAGTTPTTGAQVVDLGGVETSYQLTPQTVAALVGQNYIWADTGDISITFYYSELLPLATPNDNGKVLMVVNGAWNKVNLPVYNGGAN